jgi:rhodanese-related sulfurtransferase/DNA-binding transcriptional ArsR family regulator
MMTSRHRSFKNAINDQFARITKALASPRRIELLDALAQCPRTVESLANQTGMSVANASQHLQILRAAGLAESAKDGLFVTYRLADVQVADFLVALRQLATSRIGDVDRIVRQFVTDSHSFETVDRATLLTRVQHGEVVLLDVRPLEEYRTGHIPGARSIPVTELEQRVAELPSDRQIVAYCRGPYCLLAPEAVEILRAKGLVVSRLEDGIHEWRARGFPINVSDSPSPTV